MSSDSDPPGSMAETPVTDVFDLLADSRRRHSLTVLARTEGTVEESTLASHVRELESSTDSLRDLHLELRHCHLPKLADHGVLEYDHEEGIVDRGPAFEETLSHARKVDSLSPPQHRLGDEGDAGGRQQEDDHCSRQSADRDDHERQEGDGDLEAEIHLGDQKRRQADHGVD